MIKKSHLLVIVMVLLLAAGSSACERRAAPAMPQAGDGKEYPVPEGTQAPLEALEAITTQTAIAESGGTGEGAALQGEQSAPAEEVKPTETQQPQAEPKEEAAPQAEPGEVKEYPVPDSYTLQPGEFPYCIARRFDIAPAALLSANGLSASSMTYPGTALNIPKGAGGFNVGPRALRSHPTSYVVRSGDTANSIACLFGDVDPRAINSVNNIQGSLPIGQTIQIP